MSTDMHRVVVTAIIWRPRAGSEDTRPDYWRPATNEYLIVRRAPHLPYRPGEWTVPGGGVMVSDWHDEATQGEEDAYGVLLPALEREVSEECGPDLKYSSAWLMDDYAFMRSDGVAVLGLSYVAGWDSGGVVLNEENDSFAWVTVAESVEYNLIPDIHGELRRAESSMEPF